MISKKDEQNIFSDFDSHRVRILHLILVNNSLWIFEKTRGALTLKKLTD